MKNLPNIAKEQAGLKASKKELSFEQALKAVKNIPLLNNQAG